MNLSQSEIIHEKIRKLKFSFFINLTNTYKLEHNPCESLFSRTAKFARELVSQELPSKLEDSDGIVVVQYDEVDVGVNQSVIVVNSEHKPEPNPGL